MRASFLEPLLLFAPCGGLIRRLTLGTFRRPPLASQFSPKSFRNKFPGNKNEPLINQNMVQKLVPKIIPQKGPKKNTTKMEHIVRSTFWSLKLWSRFWCKFRSPKSYQIWFEKKNWKWNEQMNMFFSVRVFRGIRACTHTDCIAFRTCFHHASSAQSVSDTMYLQAKGSAELNANVSASLFEIFLFTLSCLSSDLP